MSTGGVTNTTSTTDTSTGFNSHQTHHEPGSSAHQYGDSTQYGDNALTGTHDVSSHRTQDDSIEYAPVGGSTNPVGTTHDNTTHYGDVHDSAHKRRGSHGSQGKSEGGLKGTLHKIVDKIHPYNTHVEVRSTSQSGV